MAISRDRKMIFQFCFDILIAERIFFPAFVLDFYENPFLLSYDAPKVTKQFFVSKARF